MTTDDTENQAPEIVHWQPTRRHASLQTVEARATPAAAVGVGAIGAAALGAFAVGALAIGALAIGRLAVGHAHFRRLEIDELVVRRLKILEP